MKNNDVILSVNKFIDENFENLEQHYYSVIDKECASYKQARDNDIYEDIENEQYIEELIDVSLVVLTANFFESEIFNFNVFRETGQRIQKLKNGISMFKQTDFRVVDAYIMKLNGYKILHLHAPETGSNTPCGSADLVRYINENLYIRPSCIISFGICYGIDPKKYNLGDTIIAEKIYPCSIGLKIDEKDWSIKHDDYIIDLRLSNPKLYHTIDDIISGRKNRKKDKKFHRAIMGNLLTGEAVVSNQKYKIQAIEKAYGCKIIGGEMEGYGLAKECICYSEIPCLIIKAICDWGACKNIDDHLDSDLKLKIGNDCKGKIQAYTAYCAYMVFKKLIFEEAFESSSIYKRIKQFIVTRYINDGYIRKNILVKTLKSNDFINTVFGKERITNNEIVGITDISLKILIKKNILFETSDEGIDGYQFSQRR